MNAAPFTGRCNFFGGKFHAFLRDKNFIVQMPLFVDYFGAIGNSNSRELNFKLYVPAKDNGNICGRLGKYDCCS